jgi:hypothetical protein
MNRTPIADALACFSLALLLTIVWPCIPWPDVRDTLLEPLTPITDPIQQVCEAMR